MIIQKIIGKMIPKVHLNSLIIHTKSASRNLNIGPIARKRILEKKKFSNILVDYYIIFREFKNIFIAFLYFYWNLKGNCTVFHLIFKIILANISK